MIVLPGLESSFDNDKAEAMLNVSVGRITTTRQLVRKSMYDFDLETPEGIEKLMALIPIMDPDILKDIMGEIWPGYPTDVDARRHRLEIKGYLKDYLESYDQEDATQQLGSGEGQGEATEAPGQEPAQAGSVAPAGNGGPPVPPTTPQPGVPDQASMAGQSGA